MFTLKRKLWAHQKQAVVRAGQHDNYALFFEVGTGKTLTAIALCLQKMVHSAKKLKVLILCPPIVCENWANEWAMSTDLGPNDSVVLKGSAKQRANLLDTTDALIYITNYETLLMKDVFIRLYKKGFDIIVFDESHRCKTHNAKRSKEAFKLALCPSVKHRFLLTGSPVLNTPMDLFMQFKIMDGGATLGKNFYTFRDTYFFDINSRARHAIKFSKWVPRQHALEQLTKKIQPYASYAKKDECLDLPPLVRTRIDFDLSPTQKRIYHSMLKEAIAVVIDGVATAPVALTKALRLMQITSGYLPVETINGDTEIKHLQNPRKDKLYELLDDLHESSKCIVWACFKQSYKDIQDVCNKLKIEYVEVHGDISAKQKQEAVERFNNEESVRVFIGHPKSGGIGINLVSSDICIFYNRDFSLESDIQAEARNYRGGSEIHKKVTRYDLVSKGTIDELIVDRLLSKQQISDDVIADLILEAGDKYGR